MFDISARDQGVDHGFNTGGGLGAGSGVSYTQTGVSQWQERRYTLRRIEQLLLRSKSNTDGIVVKETSCPIGTGRWSVTRAAIASTHMKDRDGSVPNWNGTYKARPGSGVVISSIAIPRYIDVPAGSPEDYGNLGRDLPPAVCT